MLNSVLELPNHVHNEYDLAGHLKSTTNFLSGERIAYRFFLSSLVSTSIMVLSQENKLETDNLFS
ncbi:MAG: hypothetical protein JJU16_00100 [Alkalibacterium sp.]|nr:hypothetical protein [Alkalibacterium sp.]